MDDSAQFFIPESFQALFGLPGRRRSASREHILERYEFCEDLAQLLTETCKTLQFRDGLSEDVVLERVQRGLLAPGEAAQVNAEEAQWVVRRIAELLDWPWAGLPPESAPTPD